MYRPDAPLTIWDLEEVLREMRPSFRQPSVFWVSMETMEAFDYWMRRFRRRAKHKAKMQQRRKIGRSRW